jgi:hypothetical protein
LSSNEDAKLDALLVEAAVKEDYLDLGIIGNGGTGSINLENWARIDKDLEEGRSVGLSCLGKQCRVKEKLLIERWGFV